MIIKARYAILAMGMACSSLLIHSCGNGDKTSKGNFINPPFETAKVDFNNEEIDGSVGQTIKLTNGTSIIIPANAFVDRNNNPVTGKVTIKYREFHDAADVILSGIPMSYDSAGVKGNFQTAGMFEIQGFQNNEKIYIAKDKSIHVNMASFVGGSKYNFYSLDTNSKAWSYISNNLPVINKEKADLIKAKIGPEVAKPVSPQQLDPNKFVFDLEINSKLYPELKGFQNIIWQYCGSEAAVDPEQNKWIFDEKWTNIELKMKDEAASIFWLVLSNSEKEFKSVVKPVFAGKKLENARKIYEARKNEYEEYAKKKAAEEQRLLNQADFVRSMEISSFGIYNYDYNYHLPNAIHVVANFEFEEAIDKTNLSVFLITGDDGKVVIRYEESTRNMFAFSKFHKNKLVAVMPGDKVAVFTPNDFDNIPFTRENAPKEYTFKMKTVKKKITGPADLKSIVSL